MLTNSAFLLNPVKTRTTFFMTWQKTGLRLYDNVPLTESSNNAGFPNILKGIMKDGQHFKVNLMRQNIML